MLKVTIRKELKSILLSPKFAVTLAICSVLILLSVYVGIQEYRQNVAQYQTASDLADRSLERATSWAHITDRVFRKPEPLQIFSSGLNFDVGRWSDIGQDELVKIRNSSYSDDPIFAVFRHLDLSMIVQVVLSLLAILFTFDAVSGERENGTLRLIFSNSMPRASYIAGKAIGAWLGLIIPICVPILLSLLLLQAYSIPMTGTDWMRLAGLIGVSLLYVTFFVMLGVLLSTLSRRSSVSFLGALVFWIAFVLIIPRAGIMAAGQIVEVPGQAEIEGRRDGFAKQRWKEHYDEMEREMRMNPPNDSPDSGEFNDELMWAQMMKQDSARKQVQLDIDQYERRLWEDWQNRRLSARHLGFVLSRFSPASSYQLAAMNLAGTDVGVKDRYESAMNQYRDEFNSFATSRQAESGQVGGVMITFDSDKGMSIKHSRDNAGLDLTGRPVFQQPKEDLSQVLSSVVVDFGILGLATILAFAGAALRFMTYDLR